MTQLDSVAIPATVTKIGEKAFYNCTALAILYNFAATPQSINGNVFTYVDKTTCKLYVPKSAYSLYETASVWKEFFRSEMEPISKDIYETACDSYKWNDETYTSSQNVTKTFKAVDGNDSIVTLHMTINYSSTGEETHTAEGSYEWNGTTYTASGDHKYTTTNVAGCDSVVTLHLTIIPIWQVTLIQPEHGTIAVLEKIDLNKVVDKTELHFTATPEEGWLFDAWSGCNADGSLTVTDNVTVTCTFKAVPSSLEENQNEEMGKCENEKMGKSSNHKLLRDGHLLIIRDGKTYNALGAELR